jgi:hypothetical protein
VCQGIPLKLYEIINSNMTKVEGHGVPKPPQETSGNVRVRSPYASDKADDTVKGSYGLTQKQRFETALGWLKAHGEVDSEGYEIRPPAPPKKETKKKETKKKEHGHTGHSGHGGGHSGHGGRPASYVDYNPLVEEIKRTDRAEGYLKKAKVAERDEQRDRVQEAQDLNVQRNTREVWADLLAPLGRRIAESNAEDKSLLLNKKDRDLIGIFLISAQNKMIENPDLAFLIKTDEAQPTASVKPPDNPFIDPELRSAWEKFEQLREAIHFFQMQDKNSDISFKPDEAKWLGRFLRGTFRLYPSDPATAMLRLG